VIGRLIFSFAGLEKLIMEYLAGLYAQIKMYKNYFDVNGSVEDVKIICYE
jgi:hypothetical protein